MNLLAFGKTDIGKKRKTNQDAIYYNLERSIFIVADGMGGHNGGDIASQMAVKNLPEKFDELVSAGEPIKSVLKDSVLHTNSEIKKMADQSPQLVGMGTTVNFGHIHGQHLYLANVGDSRCYLINKHKLYQLSRDHSYIQEKLNLGIYGRDLAAHDPQKNVLVRTVGFDLDLEVDVFDFKFAHGDVFILCSDGLHGRVSDHDMAILVNQYLPTPQRALQSDVESLVDSLIQLANANGGNDNISVIVIIAQ